MSNGPDSKDAALVDLVFAFCALNDCTPAAFEKLTFREALVQFHKIADENPNYIWASKEVRSEYEVCHVECHLKRMKALLEHPEHGVPKKKAVLSRPVGGTDNVVELRPANKTLH